MNPVENTEKQRVALVSFLASLGLAAVKLAAALLSGSLGLLSEAIHSMFDCAATALTLFAVRIADKPADDEHHFGHAKIESVAALIETGMLFGVTAWVAYEAISRLFMQEHAIEITWWLFAILAASVVIDWNRSRALLRAAQKSSSEALAADALHFRSDMWSSLAVMAGLALTWAGFGAGDALAALVVSGFIARAAWKLGVTTLGTLLDAAPAGVTREVEDLASAQQAVLRVNRLRVRPAGPTLFVDIAVDVPRLLSVTSTSAVQKQLTQAVIERYPNADVTVTTVPVELDSETAFEKVSLIAAEHRAAIHHLTVQDIDGRLAVSFDLEVDGRTSLDLAHQQATELEAAVREGLGTDVEVETHIEPLPQRLLTGRKLSPQHESRIGRALGKLATREKALSDLHNLRIRETENGIFVHYHCRFAPETTIEDVHEVIDRVENGLRDAMPEVARVVAHAEPVGTPAHKL